VVVEIQELGEAPPATAVNRLEHWLNLGSERVVHACALGDTLSPLFSRVLAGGQLDSLLPPPFVPPPWVHLRVVDPSSGEDARQGAPGLLALGDLACQPGVPPCERLYAVMAAATTGGGVRLLGSATGETLAAFHVLAEQGATVSSRPTT
jgi:hypothetical protein